MKKIIFAVLAAVLTAASAGARGQDAPSVFTKIKPKVGAWAEYSFESKKGDKLKSKGRFRLAVVGKQGDDLWLEQRFTLELPKPKKDEAGGAMKFLAGKDGVKKAYMKTGDGVMDMSAMMSSKKKPNPADMAKMTEVGEEKIEVPAGKFKTTRYAFEEGKNKGDAWMKPGVGPYGMIKQVHAEGKEIATMELLASGDDAKSEIDEKSAQTPFGAMTGGRRESPVEENESPEAAPEKAEKPSFGGMFKNALKKKAGLGD